MSKLKDVELELEALYKISLYKDSEVKRFRNLYFDTLYILIAFVIGVSLLLIATLLTN